jgi:glycosyltransferase XagB
MSAPSKKEPLGDIALRLGYIKQEQLTRALELQSESGSMIGEILVGENYIRPIDLNKVLSAQLNISQGTTDLDGLAGQADLRLAKLFTITDLMKELFFPIKKTNETIYVMVHNPQSEIVDKLIAAQFGGMKIEKVLATKRDIIKLVEKCFRTNILEESVMGLFYRSPAESVKQTLTHLQKVILIVMTIFSIYMLIFQTYHAILTFIVFFNFLFLASIIFKFVLSIAGSYQEGEPDESIAYSDLVTLTDLPVYTVLVPVFREPAVMLQLISGLQKLDYPKEKLEVLFLFEEIDKETLEAAKKANPPGHWHFIIIPSSEPQTKPKACNFGLALARGEYITIYDAEDVPEPDQLKKAVYAFRNHPEKYICFQAALNYFNSRTNILTRLFTLEYSYWFDFLIKGLDLLRLPIPLGGTSNHFRTEKLRELGGWDPFNVTEDADLGIRAFGRGYKVGVINSTTYEEATSKIKPWLKQRSRWLKGYLQTFLVHNRNPLAFLKAVGFRGWLTLQIFIGGSVFTNLVAPFFWAMFLYWLITRGSGLDKYFYGYIYYISLFNLLFGNFMAMYLSTLAVFRRKYFHLTYYSLLVPFYYVLQSIAAWKALIQLFTNPYYWEKTTHGFDIREATSDERIRT